MVNQATAFINPMQQWDSIGAASQRKDIASGNQEVSLFHDIFKNTIDQVYTTQKDVEEKQYLLVTGQLDDAHSLPIAEAKAALSLDAMITLRNKVLESYNELIKMSV